MFHDDFIEHFGVKGMKWGVRRNRSGSTGRSSPKKTVKSLSDSELKAKVARLNLENQYVNLVSQSNKRNQTAINKGISLVGSIVGSAAKQAVTNYAAKGMTSVIKEVLG